MSDERLTDERIAEIAEYGNTTGLRAFVSSPQIVAMAIELRARRRADLSSEEREALASLAADLRREGERLADFGYESAALSVISRLLRNATKEPNRR